MGGTHEGKNKIKKIAKYNNKFLDQYNNIDTNILNFKVSGYGSLVLYNIMKGYYDNKPLTAEQIITGIDPKFGSRNAVLNLIKKSEKAGIISRVISKQDKREKVIIPSKSLVDSHKKMLSFILSH
jgi:hypothetical protein